MTKKEIEALLSELIDEVDYDVWKEYFVSKERKLNNLIKIVQKHTKKPKITFVDGDDWEGMYIDGKLIIENHVLSVPEVLEKSGLEYDEVFADQDWLAEHGSLPEKLKDVKIYKE